MQLQRRLMAEARGWLARYGEACRDQQRRQTARLMAHLTQEARRLAQPISDLEDVRAAMEVLRRVRDMEIDTDRAIEPIEVSCGVGDRISVWFRNWVKYIAVMEIWPFCRNVFVSYPTN